MKTDFYMSYVIKLLTFISGSAGDGGETASKPETTVQDNVSTFVSVSLLDIFNFLGEWKETGYIWGDDGAFSKSFCADKTVYFDKRSGHFSAEFIVTKLNTLMRCQDIFSSYGLRLNQIFLMKPQDISSFVCADVTRYFKPKHDLSFTLTKCKLNQTVITGRKFVTFLNFYWWPCRKISCKDKYILNQRKKASVLLDKTHNIPINCWSAAALSGSF